MTETQQNNSYVLSSQSSAYMSESALKWRTDPKVLLTDIQKYLEGKQLVLKEKNGRKYWEYDQVGKEKLNPQGIQAVMGIIHSLLNPHTIMGNFKAEDLNDFLSDVFKDLAFVLMSNRCKYEMELAEYPLIMFMLKNSVRIILTRTIDNLERSGIEKGVKVNENVVQKHNPYQAQPGGY